MGTLQEGHYFLAYKPKIRAEKKSDWYFFTHNLVREIILFKFAKITIDNNFFYYLIQLDIST